MSLPSNFPKNPHQILDPDLRWTPDSANKENELAPLVSRLRLEVKDFRDSGYKNASPTSKALLKHWFSNKHFVKNENGQMQEFQYYFCQREAIETIIYLYEIIKCKDSSDLYDLFDTDLAHRLGQKGLFPELWRRFVCKMATGSGKTKLISLVITWSYFHKLYENSDLSQNFLLISPNIIVLDRLLKDFDGSKIFSQDPLIPEDGFENKNWTSDFSMTIHIQDDLKTINPKGNLFLSNIHRVYKKDIKEASLNDTNLMDYFLGNKPVTETNQSTFGLEDVVRDIDNLVVINDEAHHIHDKKLAWFTSIEDIHHKLVQKNSYLSLQIDVTATPKKEDGSIFPQTISDYPLVEAIKQKIVKEPIIPDQTSQKKLKERKHHKFSQKYKDYLHLGVKEWKQDYKENKKMDKKSILFVMTDDTTNCDDVAKYLESIDPELENSVLTIHTNSSGNITESDNKKNQDELKKLRNEANNIDSWESPFKAVVSVMMLKEGWDVKNVTTIVGLRAYKAKNKILPEQTLGRGLRRMGFPVEQLKVIGTKEFLEFVSQIKNQGVEIKSTEMNMDQPTRETYLVEIDIDNKNKNLEELDIKIPILSKKFERVQKSIKDLDLKSLKFTPLNYKIICEDQNKEIIFREILKNDIRTITDLDNIEEDNYRGIIGYLTRTIHKDMRLVTEQDILHEKIKRFCENYLFGKKVDLENYNTVANLSRPDVLDKINEVFKAAINDLTLNEKVNPEIKKYKSMLDAKPFRWSGSNYIKPKKSVFNKIVKEHNSHFELEFAGFLERCDDIISYVKNYNKNGSINFHLDYVRKNQEISSYFPDFIIKKSKSEVFIAETKGYPDPNVDEKTKRLQAWCEDANKAQSKIHYDFIFIDFDGFRKKDIVSFSDLLSQFTKYKDVG